MAPTKECGGLSLSRSLESAEEEEEEEESTLEAEIVEVFVLVPAIKNVA